MSIRITLTRAEAEVLLAECRTVLSQADEDEVSDIGISVERKLRRALSLDA